MTATPEVVMVGNVGVDTNVYLHAEEIDFSVGPTSSRWRWMRQGATSTAWGIH